MYLEISRRAALSHHGLLSIWYEDIELSWFYLRPMKPKKYFLLLRDPAEWLWASFNFWQDGAVDVGDYKGHGPWVNASINYRSPELFHELIASGNRTKGGSRLNTEYREWTIHYPRRLRAMVGEENSIFLRNEDMLPSVVAQEGGFLDRVAAFTGLDRAGFDVSTYSHVTNCNDNKGPEAKCSDARSGGYSVTGGRSMLPETRRLIYLQFWEECKIWKEEFGIEYPDCLNVMA